MSPSSSPNKVVWTLCLKELSAGTLPKKVTLKLEPTASCQTLADHAAETFAIPKETIQLHFGVPPMRIHLIKTLQEMGIQNLETITVARYCDDAEEIVEIVETEAASLVVSRPKSKRAASAQAMEHIKLQNAMMIPIQQNQATRKTSPAKHKFPPTALGRRLADDTALEAPLSSPTKKQKNKNNNTSKARPLVSSQNDPSVALLDSFHSTDASARGLRRGWRQAVTEQSETNRAACRLAAAVANQYSIEIVNANNTSDTNAHHEHQQQQLTAVYAKGLQGRGNYTETVDFIQLDVLKSVIADLYPSEALRPVNLAFHSPRVFWSLLHHVPSTTIEQALQDVQPDLDWSYLRRRPEQLSAKARENERQKAELEKTHDDGNLTLAAAAIESVEQAMIDMHQGGGRHHEEQPLTAAFDTHRRVEWKIVTPADVDEDEMRACIMTHDTESTTGTATANDLVRQLIDDCNINNWRELANADAEAIAEQLDADCRDVVAWIDRAQAETLEEIMVEICRGNVAGVELLREHANSGTPKDLKAWASIVETLHETLVEACVKENSAEIVPGIEELAVWCDRACQAVEQLEWLDLFVQPIE
jgi:hypothetical protein